MRTLITVSIPCDAGNNAVQDGSLPKIMAESMERLKPEAAYFTTIHGRRTALLVFDLKDSSDMPSIAEPFFSGFNAEVTFSPVMTADDLKAGLGKIQAAK
jgi:hypothetical protein